MTVMPWAEPAIYGQSAAEYCMLKGLAGRALLRQKRLFLSQYPGHKVPDNRLRFEIAFYEVYYDMQRQYGLALADRRIDVTTWPPAGNGFFQIWEDLKRKRNGLMTEYEASKIDRLRQWERLGKQERVLLQLYCDYRVMPMDVFLEALAGVIHPQIKEADLAKHRDWIKKEVARHTGPRRSSEQMLETLQTLMQLPGAHTIRIHRGDRIEYSGGTAKSKNKT